MKTININQLQAQISRVMKDVEGGEVYEVMRYSRPVAVIRAKSGQATQNEGCKDCIAKIDEVLKIVESK